jgi:hypothetical protein
MIAARILIAATLMTLAGTVAGQITSEMPLSQPVFGNAPNNQFNPLVASDGTDFLVAWIDYRGPASIYLSRVTHTGNILDGTGIRVPTDPVDGASTPGRLLGLFHIDGAYTLIYQTYEYYPPSPFPSTTQAVIISDDGRILDGPRQIIDHAVGLVASNGSRIVIVKGTDVFVLDGRAEVVNQLHWPGVTGTTYGASIASNGSTFLLVAFAYVGPYEGLSDSVNLIAFDAGGQLTDVTRVNTSGEISGEGDAPIISSDGADYLVLYFDHRQGQVAVSVSAHAAIRSTAALSISQSVESGALSWTGQGYLLASTPDDWRNQMAVMGLSRTGSLAGNGQSLEGASAPPFYAPGPPALAWNGSEALIAWESSPQPAIDGLEIHAALVGADGTPRSSVLTVPTASNAQAIPVIATGGLYDLAVWQEVTGIYAARVTSNGVALDGRGILVSAQTTASGSLGEYQTLRVIFDGAAYLVAWDSGGVKGQRIDPATGSLLGAPITLASCGGPFDLENDGTSPVLFAIDCTFGEVTYGRLYAQRVGATGAVGPTTSISPSGMSIGQPRAAWNGHEWLVAWTKLIQDQIVFLTRGNVYAARLSSELTILDTQPIEIAVSSFDEEGPLVASDGRDFVVAWTRSYGAPAGAYLRHVHSDGTIGDLTLFDKNGYLESFVWDGALYAAAYEETVACSPVTCQYRSYLTHFEIRDDVPVLFDRVPIGDNLANVSLGAPANGRVRIVYSRYAPEPPYAGSARAFMRDDVYVNRHRAARSM